MSIPFNKPFLTGNELQYISDAVRTGKISGDGLFTERCHRFFEKRYGFRKVLLTTSCTDALEMAAILLNIREGDEVIAPSFTFVSTVNAFVLRGARIVFADSSPENPNIDAASVERLITAKTKAIVVTHYGGIACDMDVIKRIAGSRNIPVVEDAAQCIDSFYKGKPLGSLGTLGAFSFHETKNVMCGEGGMLVINEEQYFNRAEVIREKGTNRSAFFRGETEKYEWIDIGSSFLPSEVSAAFLFAQLEQLEKIQLRRKELWELYHRHLQPMATEGKFSLPFIPSYTTNNAHLFYLVFKRAEERDKLLLHLRTRYVHAVFHYQSLHTSSYYKDKHDGRELQYADFYSHNLLRLPMYYELKDEEVEYICKSISAHFNQ